MVESVNHPCCHPILSMSWAEKQMKGAGGLFSFFIKADNKETVFAFAEKLKHFTLAVSWGGHESLIIPMAAFYDMPGRENPSAPLNLVRLYIGLEELEFLWEDLDHGLEFIEINNGRIKKK
ncbi:MAG: PLP-dependent transferase [Saprospiraceae bacterium]